MLVTLPWNRPVLKFPQVELNVPKINLSASVSGFLFFNMAEEFPSPV